MSLRFSLLGLIGLVSLSGLACAALVQPGPGWLSVVVTLTAAVFAFQCLMVLFGTGPSRAAAGGWLLLVAGYLAMALGPWLGQHVGPQLVSSKALLYAQVNWRKEDPNPQPAQQQIMNLNLWGRNIVDGTSSTILINDISGGSYLSLMPQPPVVSVNCFQLSGHWLFAWLAGWLGSALAVQFYRRKWAHAWRGP